MTKLIDALSLYAAENVIPYYQRENFPQIRAAQIQADKLSKQLQELGPEAADWVNKLNSELDTMSFYQERASLLAGISIGLKLARL